MASKRNKRRRECERKRRYASQEVAIKSARVLRKKSGDLLLHSYSCSFCRFFHVGHMPSKLLRYV